MPIYLMSIRVLLSLELCVTLKTYLKGAPFYNAWKSRAFWGISKLGGKVCFWTFPPSVFSTAGHGPRFCKLHRRQVTQRRMRPDMIVVPLPVADLAVEAFDVAILHRPARRDEVQLYSVLIRPPVQDLAGELRTVVDDHVLRFSSLLFPSFQHPHHAQPWQRSVHLDLQCLAGTTVHQVQRTESSSAGERVLREVHRPDLVRLGRRRQHQSRCGGGPSASALTANAQLLLHIQPVYPLVVYYPPFAHQQHLQPAVAEPAPFFGQLAQPHSQLAVLRPSPIPIRPTMSLDQPAGASL